MILMILMLSCEFYQELQLIENEDNYYLGEVLQLPNVAYLPPTAKLIIKLKV